MSEFALPYHHINAMIAVIVSMTRSFAVRLMRNHTTIAPIAPIPMVIGMVRSKLEMSGMLDEFDEHAAAVFGMDEVDPRATGADARFGVQQSHP